MAFLGEDTIMALPESVSPANPNAVSTGVSSAAPAAAQAVPALPAGPLVPAKLSLMDRIRANPGKAALVIGGVVLAGWWLLRKKPAAQG